MRQADGWHLPPSAPAETMPDAVPAAEHPEPVRTEVLIDVVRAVDGRLTVVDLVPKPGVIWDLMRVEAVARGVSLPGLAFDRIELRGADRKFGDLQVAGNRSGGMTSFEASSQGLSLAAANPYLRLERPLLLDSPDWAARQYERPVKASGHQRDAEHGWLEGWRSRPGVAPRTTHVPIELRTHA